MRWTQPTLRAAALACAVLVSWSGAFAQAVEPYESTPTLAGKDHAKYLPVPRTSSEDVATFLASWAEARRIVPAGDAKAWLEVGRYGWTLPIPIVKGASGWSFDVSAMADELRTRRIGRNELDAIQVMRAYVDAQDD